jgi:hypothetical protein
MGAVLDPARQIEWSTFVLVAPVLLAIAWLFVLAIRTPTATANCSVPEAPPMTSIPIAGVTALGTCLLFLVYFVWVFVLFAWGQPSPL